MADDVPASVPLSVRAPLDTANPITDRAPGTLIEATDLATRWWGPRLGALQFTSVSDTSARSGAGDNLITFDGSDDDVVATMYNLEQCDLGVRWTLDIVFRCEDLDHTTTNATIFSWTVNDGANLAFDPHTVLVEIVTDGANEGKVIVRLQTNDGSGLADDIAITADTAITAGTAPEDIHFLRVMRDRANVWVVLDRATVGTSTSMTATATNKTMIGKRSGSYAGQWCLATAPPNSQFASNANFKGKIYKALFRSGKHVEYTSAFHDFLFSRAWDVKLAVGGSRIVLSDNYVLDHSRFETRGVVTGSPSVADSQAAPFLHPIQGLGYYTDNQGVTNNIVICGGRIYLERVL